KRLSCLLVPIKVEQRKLSPAGEKYKRPLVDGRGHRQVAFLAEHRAVEDVDQARSALRADDEKPLVDQKVRHARHAASANLCFLRQYRLARRIVIQGPVDAGLRQSALLSQV